MQGRTVLFLCSENFDQFELIMKSVPFLSLINYKCLFLLDSACINLTLPGCFVPSWFSS